MAKEKEKPFRDKDPLHRIADALEHINDTGQGFLEEWKKQHQQPPHGGSNLAPKLSAIYGRRSAMAVNVPVPKLLDVEKILLSVMPRKADGHIDITTPMSWSSDSGSIGVEVGTAPFAFTDPQFPDDGEQQIPGDRNCFALTPEQSGTGNVTVSGGSAYEDAVFGPIEYAPGQPRSLNASVGSPVSDL